MPNPPNDSPLPVTLAELVEVMRIKALEFDGPIRVTFCLSADRQNRIGYALTLDMPAFPRRLFSNFSELVSHLACIGTSGANRVDFDQDINLAGLDHEPREIRTNGVNPDAKLS